MKNNARYYDVLTRHQIYVECVKLGIAAGFGLFASKLASVIRVRLLLLNVKTLDQLTKSQLNALIREIHNDQAKLYREYAAQVVLQLQDFANADMAQSKYLFERLDEESTTDDPSKLPAIPTVAPTNTDVGGKGTGLFGLLLLLGSKSGQDKLWSTIINAPLPANGLAPLTFFNGSMTSAMASVEAEVRKGFANRSPVTSVVEKVTGTTAAKNADGVLARVANQQRAVVETLAQHVSSTVQAAVMSVYFERYIWCSVIDGRTTTICLDRNGNVYVFGEGPLPPAHIGCRSEIVPLVGADAPPEHFFAWLKSQPLAFLQDILPPLKLEALQSGKLRLKDVPRFDDAIPMSVKEFSTKLETILQP